MTTVAEEEVLTAAELDLVGSLTDDAEAGGVDAPVADSAAETAAPFFTVVKGNPSDEEVAALVCVLSAAAESTATGPSGPPDLWGRPSFMHRGTSPFSPYAFPQLSHLRG
ncbi:acyl-CoA carboxylase epsilon subunit-like protein [Nocardia tenerifensis]|uniref:Acyl-CoA carboxylase epsilon subunit-like protein n=1 Tax=Nocardia tenerifensis TaxID=228006 RepID=A0A318KGW6_9NOCA|nr:acyl-CoA carboxylase subunit epsilon [Nocardia tenerifensis]PXX66353.1 acyl-CoA carboxylase epsilon subunit-like protein [Nocardia tenerifensis]